MRKAMLLLGVVSLVSSLWAADPMLGTWKLNVAKSKYGSSDAAKEATVVWKDAAAGEYEFTIKGTLVNGSPISYKGTMPAAGGLTTLREPVPVKGEMGITTIVSPGNWYITFIKDGKQTGFIHSIVSKDGKTCTNTSRGMDSKGKFVEDIEVYEKQ